MGDFGFLYGFIPFLAITLLGYYKLFEKAGEPGWKALIPGYNLWIHLQITGRPSWWILYMLIPIINVFVLAGMVVDLLKSFGKTRTYQQALGLSLFFVYFNYMGFNKNINYLGKATELPKEKKSGAKEWADAIVFAVIAATFIRWVFLEAFTIPTPSMEKSLLVGDFLFVSKIHYGPRTPKTPLQMPLTHQKIWLTDHFI